jgi:phage N-6-adenine-methyltransferase
MTSRVRGTNSDEWQTPDLLWSKLNNQYGFTLDAAASQLNSKCQLFYSQQNSFLTNYVVDPSHIIWCNPPFSCAHNFINKLGEIGSNGTTKIVSIYRSDNMETKTWSKIWANASWVFIFSKRIHYINPVGGDSCPFGSSLFGWNCEPPAGLNGTLIRSWSVI